MDQRSIAGKRPLSLVELAVIIILACVPLFVSFPYRVNIFLSWEGAYRMSEGQLPFKDFGTPLGGMFWVIPAIFFKLFGPQMISLIKAQVFINILSGLAFRSILKSCGVQPGIRFVSVLLYCLSFSFFNFWPWYNHSVIVYEFIGLAFLLKYMTGTQGRFRIVWLVLAALFTCFSVLTKQDAGGMAFMISCVLLAYYGWVNKKWLSLLIYIGSFAILFLLIIAPFLSGGFGYWFNHGQPPHSARVSVFEILDDFLSNSQWIKFYLFLILLIMLAQYRNWKAIWQEKGNLLFFLVTICVLGEAAVFQVTSYTPPDNNIFFHSFAIAFILYSLARLWPLLNFNKLTIILACVLGILVWWSDVYWKYMQRIVARVFPKEQTAGVSPTGENVINRNTYMINLDTAGVPESDWTFSGLKSFDKIYMPKQTVEGMRRLMDMELVKQNKDLKVLNMSELTPLAAEIPYKLESNEELPLWYHLGVGMFNRQAEIYEQRIQDHYYDLVLFEYIPSLNNFYPFRVRDSLRNHYQMVDEFVAPRRGNTHGMIEVYVRPAATDSIP